MKRTQTHLARSARPVCVVCVALLLTLVGGCASRTPYLDTQFGKSVRLLNAQQTINPNAMANTDPVLGLDGKAAASAYGEYQNSYSKPKPPSSTFTIGIGN